VFCIVGRCLDLIPGVGKHKVLIGHFRSQPCLESSFFSILREKKVPDKEHLPDNALDFRFGEQITSAGRQHLLPAIISGADESRPAGRIFQNRGRYNHVIAKLDEDVLVCIIYQGKGNCPLAIVAPTQADIDNF
jgi:hypothetical protein